MTHRVRQLVYSKTLKGPALLERLTLNKENQPVAIITNQTPKKEADTNYTFSIVVPIEDLEAFDPKKHSTD